MSYNQTTKTHSIDTAKDISVIKKCIDNVKILFFSDNIDYEREFLKNDFYIDKEIVLNLKYLINSAKLNFSYILNINKIKIIEVKDNADILNINQFKNLEHIKIYINSEINVEDIIYKYNYPKSLKIFELNNNYKNYSLKYMNSNNVDKLFETFKNKGLYVKKAIINNNTYYNTDPACFSDDDDDYDDSIDNSIDNSTILNNIILYFKQLKI